MMLMNAILAPDRQLQLSDPLRSLTASCCVVCVPECCGVDAYEISARHMVPWLMMNGRATGEQALSQLDQLIAWAAGQTEELWSDGPEFNAIWYPLACIDNLGKWRQELVTALSIEDDPTPRPLDSESYP
jgi:hypothetical protein